MPTKRAFNSAFNSAFSQFYSEFSIFQAQWLKIINSLSSLAVDCSVNVYRMVIGAADAETGVYAVTYESAGERQAIIVERKKTLHYTAASAITEETAVFILDEELNCGDRLVTADGVIWQVQACTPIAVGNCLMAYRAEAASVTEAEATAVSGWMCLVIGDYGVAEVSPSGLRYLAADEELTASATAKDGYTLFKWLLDGVEVEGADYVTVKPQSSGVIHVLIACTWSSGEIHVYPEASVLISEGSAYAAALGGIEQLKRTEDVVPASAYALDAFTSRSENVIIENA